MLTNIALALLTLNNENDVPFLVEMNIKDEEFIELLDQSNVQLVCEKLCKHTKLDVLLAKIISRYQIDIKMLLKAERIQMIIEGIKKPIFRSLDRYREMYI